MHHVAKARASLQQLVVPTLRYHAPLAELDNRVTALHRRKSMCNEHDGEVASQGIDCVHDGALRCVIQRTRSFVEYQYVCALVERARNPYTLTLTAGEPHTSLSHLGFIPFAA